MTKGAITKSTRKSNAPRTDLQKKTTSAFFRCKTLGAFFSGSHANKEWIYFLSLALVRFFIEFLMTWHTISWPQVFSTRKFIELSLIKHSKDNSEMRKVRAITDNVMPKFVATSIVLLSAMLLPSHAIYIIWKFHQFLAVRTMRSVECIMFGVYVTNLLKWIHLSCILNENEAAQSIPPSISMGYKQRKHCLSVDLFRWQHILILDKFTVTHVALLQR